MDLEAERTVGQGEDGSSGAGELDLTNYVELFRHSLDGILLTCPDGTTLAANPAACEILRSDEARLCAVGRPGVADPTDVRWQQAVEERAASGRVRTRARMVRGDGTTVECEITSTIFRMPSGETRSCVLFRDISSSAEMVAALAESEALWRTTVDHAPIGIAVVGLDGRWRSVNKALCTIVGYDEPSLLDSRFQDITHPDDLDADLELAHQVLRGELPWYQMEKRYIRPDGGVVPVRLSVSVVRDDAGEPLHFVSQVQDIRAERALLEAVRTSERQLAEAQETARIGSWTYDVATRTLSWSAQMYRLHGVEGHVPPGPEEYLAMVRPEDRPILLGAMADARERGRRVQASYRIEVADQTYDIHALAEPVFGDDGEIVAVRGTAQDVTESQRSAAALRQANEQLLELATTDVLTGLANRAVFSDRLDQALALASRTGWEVGVLFIDLDRFKHINDSLGHQWGDELLVEVARRITSTMRDTDTVARLGGDEFAILLGGSSSAVDASQAAMRVLACFDASFQSGGIEHFVSASIGVARSARSGGTRGQLLQHADLAMYRAKAAGGGCFEVFHPTMTAAAHRRLQLETDLRRAIEGGELFLRYHPQVDLGTGEVLCVEALIRWQHPTEGEMAPAGFIPQLEETGLIVPVGAWVVEEACREARRLRDDLPRATPVRMSVNISPRQLLHPGVIDVVADALAATGTAPSQLELEITESTLIGEGTGAAARVAALRDGGHPIAIDDFGTGYSSLAYLRRFPVDRLKLDRSFIAELATGGGPLVAAAQHLADALGLEAIAEGVETDEQRLALIDLGCTQGQGYLWTEPLTADDLHAWLGQRVG